MLLFNHPLVIFQRCAFLSASQLSFPKAVARSCTARMTSIECKTPRFAVKLRDPSMEMEGVVPSTGTTDTTGKLYKHTRSHKLDIHCFRVTLTTKMKQRVIAVTYIAEPCCTACLRLGRAWQLASVLWCVVPSKPLQEVGWSRLTGGIGEMDWTWHGWNDRNDIWLMWHLFNLW